MLRSLYTAATGMDALTHNIESYLSPAWHPMCDGIALEGVRKHFAGVHAVDGVSFSIERGRTLALKPVVEGKVPLMIDSTDERVLAMALTYSQGKAIINSVNLEDGEERFEKVVPLAREFGLHDRPHRLAS